ncbi:hypothetical protein BAX93_05440 [Elizabethkingia meningoseptica]|uniref:hypothetical protein n=1 Tax=Elizabethkingia meningoseptica TaxID=238 RepID=UPI00099974B5|nr:hypothetical protein [Elizabethkingia meningoseptica]OPC11945.1 hypothetical protein BAX93_05440 [Elizabethkingia meningoseptica]
MTKNEAIKAAYREHYDLLKENIDENGRIPVKIIKQNMQRLSEEFYDSLRMVDVLGEYYQPEQLAGIYNNRGWTRIESEEDLPKEPGHYFAIDIFRSEPCIIVFEEALKKNWLEVVSHYQPIETPKPPIF